MGIRKWILRWWSCIIIVHVFPSATLISPRKEARPGPWPWAAECDGGGVDQNTKMDDRVGICVGVAVVLLERVTTCVHR